MKTATRNGEVDVSVVFPAYNERKNLKRTIMKTIEALRKITDSFEIIIAEDGSTDGTAKIAAELSSDFSCVRHIHRDARLGRGLALKNAFTHANGKIMVYMDVDLSTNIRHLRMLIDSVDGNYDFATGSRMLRESKVSRGVSRSLTSRGYNFMVRSLLGSKVTDHQCGFKSWKRDVLLNLLDEVDATHWFWDTEMLVRAARRGFRIKEIPIEWTHKGETKVNLIRDSIQMGSQVLRLCWELRK
jgi:glycosyltransferase involved in cell wall biosynthesis